MLNKSKTTNVPVLSRFKVFEEKASFETGKFTAIAVS
jgi:hypothetical protein